jgi:hypothetical protein
LDLSEHRAVGRRPAQCVPIARAKISVQRLTPYDRFSADGSNGEGLIEIYEVP